MDLQKFREDFERSGMTQREYGATIDMSGGMVSYYLRKSRKKEDANEDAPSFTPISVVHNKSSKAIEIITPSGLEIRIPI